MPLGAGDRLGPYEITGQLGAGGMGIVLRAHDTQLNRDVALKILPDAFAADPDRLARFQREAQVLASLNHPNIAQIHGIEEAEPSTQHDVGRGLSPAIVQALVLELVEGPTLADRIAQGPIPLDQALPIAKQIAEALEAAHEAGVIHRDLKPANIKVRNDGTVKVLDFGLAKALGPAFEADASQVQTVTAVGTATGVIMGTATYMSPEQAQGKPLDRRADIWAFGCVLYEMLTGERAFKGGNVSETLAAVLRAEPVWKGLPANTPAPIGTLLQRCLEKDPRERVPHIAVARFDIEDARTASRLPEVGAAASLRSIAASRRVLGVVLAASIGLGAASGFLVWTITSPRATPQAVKRFVMAAAERQQISGRAGNAVAVSPDGQHVVYATGVQLYVRAMDEIESRPLPGTEGAVHPFFSPDGRWVGFIAGGVVKKVLHSGGNPLDVSRVTGVFGATWAPNDTIVLGTNRGLMRVAASGGSAETLTTAVSEAGEIGHRWPHVLPGGDAVLYTSSRPALRDASLAVLALERGDPRLLLEGYNARYVPTGHLIYMRSGTLMAAPFDLDRLEMTGAPAPLIDALASRGTGAADFAVADDGTFVSVPARGTASSTLVWVDRNGGPTPVVEEPDDYWQPRLGPGGNRVAVGVGPDIWVIDVERRTPTRLTFGETSTLYPPSWTPDGTRIVFPSPDRGIYTIPADGSGRPELLLTGDYLKFPTSWSPDGRVLAYHQIHPETARDLWVLRLDDARQPSPFLVTPFEERSPSFSPDGRWLAYVSDESGRDQVYVQPYPGPGAKVPISRDGGTEPVWCANGELFYRNGAQMLVVRVNTHPTFVVGTPTVLFEEPRYQLDAGAGRAIPVYDVLPDGQRLVMVQAGGGGQIHVVLNWFEELTERVPVP